jgi:hypothetical protein
MNQEYLLETARRLIQPPPEAADEFAAQRDALADELNQRMGARPDLDKLIGSNNLAMMQDNSRNFCRFMDAMFHGYEPDVLVHTALWVFRAYRSHGFQTTYWAANLDTFVEIVRQRLSPAAFHSVDPFFDWLIVNIPLFVRISDQQLDSPLGEMPRHTGATRDERGRDGT